MLDHGIKITIDKVPKTKAFGNQLCKKMSSYTMYTYCH